MLSLCVALAVLLASAVISPAAGQEVIQFDFESAPDGDAIDPTFTDPRGAFSLSHTPGAVRGNSQWATGGLVCTPHTGDGCMRLSDIGIGAVAVTGTINFSEPVDAVTLWAFSIFGPATITPIVEGGGMLAPIPLTDTYAQYVISGDGPYIGLLLSAQFPNLLMWDDLQVTLGLVEISHESLLGAETETTNLLAVNPFDATGQVIGNTGIFPFTALAKDPTTGILYGGGVLRDPPILYTYQTTVEFDDSLDGIDTAIIDWITTKNTGNVSETDLTYLSIALLDGATHVYTDIPIINGVPQPIGGEPRVITDIFWDFDHGTNKLFQLFNVSIAVLEASSGTQYSITDGDNFNLDGGMTRLDRYFDGSEPGVDISAGTTQDTRLLRIEGAPALYEIDETTGVATQLGILGTNVVSINGADFDAAGQLWAAITVTNDGEFEALAMIDKTDGSATLVGGDFGAEVDCIDGISFDRTGTLWGISSCNDELYEIDLSNGEAEFITEVFVGEGAPIPADGFQSLQFNCANTLFAGLGESEGDGGDLYTIATDFGDAERVGEVSATDGSSLGGLALHTTCETNIVTETPEGTDVPVFSIIGLEEVAAEVVVEGETRVSICVGRDARWSTGVEPVFTARTLGVSELSATGSCTGQVLSGSMDPTTWETLLLTIDLTVDSRYRSYLGEFTVPVLGPTIDYWLVLAVIRTDAEFEGVVAVETVFEELIDYSMTPAAESPQCDQNLTFRSLDMGGAVDAFGEFLNVEGNSMIVETAQCNRNRSMTRRTTHLYPLHLQNFGETNVEQANVVGQLTGIKDTLTQAVCADFGLLTAMQAALDDAETAFDEAHYANAQVHAEQLARLAKETVTGFASCLDEENYRGNFMARALTLAFTFHDRFEHPDEYELYLVPVDLEVPLLAATSVNAPDAPENMVARAKRSRVNVAWQESAGAENYRVFRRLNTEVGFTEVGQVSNPVYVDNLPSGTSSAEYYVVAENESGQSGPSATVMVTATARRRR